MGLFGKDEDDLRASGTPTTARVVYVDDTGKRRGGGGEARVKVQVKIDSGSARGRELDKTKWVPAARIPRVGETVSVRIDPDSPDDWAWGDAGMYAPGGTAPPAGPAPPRPAGMAVAAYPNQQSPAAAAPGAAGIPQGEIEPMVEFVQAAAGPWGKMPGFKQMIEQAVASNKVSYGNQVFVADASQFMQAAGAAAAPAPAAPESTDPAERLRKLDALRDQGLLTEDEHRNLRQKIIDSI